MKHPYTLRDTRHVKVFRRVFAHGLTRSRKLGSAYGWIAAALVCCGCRSIAPYAPTALTPPFRPANHFSQFERLPAFVQRVAVLPIAVPKDNWYAAQVRPDIEPILRSELGKLNRFELAAVTPQQLLHWTGQASWTAQEALPPDLFQRLRNELNCDAVLFSELASYHPYRPLRMGWTMKLVDARIQTVLWATDEVFDAAQSDVAAAAVRHYDQENPEARKYRDPERILLSPSKFSQYTLEALLASIPAR